MNNKQMPSDRSFGGVFIAVFLIIAMYPVPGGGEPNLWAFVIAGGLGVLVVTAPRILHPLNVVWYRFGLVLHGIVSPLVLGFIFFVTIMPIGLLLRAFGKDLLRLRWDPSADTYWIPRDPPGPSAESMRNQF
jgi:hypothetical protein